MSYLEKLIKKQETKYHKDTYINFRKEADKQKLKKDELEAKLDELTRGGYIITPHTTKRAQMSPKSYSLVVRRDIISLTVYDGVKYYYFYTNYRNDRKNEIRKSPMSEFKNLFIERNNLKIQEAFGSVGQNFKLFVPTPLYYMSGLWPKFEIINNVSKEDFSSHYPAAASQLLPDAKTAKIIDKYIKPDEEYKFAFYPDTGHIAVYNEFDTHTYINYINIYTAKPKKERLYKTDYKNKDTRTILMKESKYSLRPEMQHFYNIKNTCKKDTEEYEAAKLFINQFIGMFEQNKLTDYQRLPLAHLAAVIKWRANIKMFNTIKTIGDENVIQVVVDGIIHYGKAIGTKEKALGNLIIEESNAKFIQRGINQYIVFGKETERKYAGFDINIESDNIEDWQASPKVKFLDYIKSMYVIEEL